MNDDYHDPKDIPKEEFFPPIKKEENVVPHYYGDAVRKYLLIAVFVLLYAALEDHELLNFYLSVGVIGTLLFVILAGLTSPLKRQYVIYDVVVSSIMFLIFEYLALHYFTIHHDFFDLVFFLRQLLAILFIAILYFSIKTLRGAKFKKKN